MDLRSPWPTAATRCAGVAGQVHCLQIMERVLTTLRLTNLGTSVKVSGTEEP